LSLLLRMKLFKNWNTNDTVQSIKQHKATIVKRIFKFIDVYELQKIH